MRNKDNNFSPREKQMRRRAEIKEVALYLLFMYIPIMLIIVDFFMHSHY